MGEIIVALVIGLVGGFAGGFLGVGGGAIYVPAKVLLMDEQQHLAQGASLAAIVATAAFLANALDAGILRRIFGVVIYTSECQ